VIIGNDVTSIGRYAFYDCPALQSVVVGNGITSLPDYVFGTGKNLKSLTIGTGVLSISSYAFKNNNGTYKPIKTVWLTNTPPDGYTNAEGKVNYVANDLYPSLNSKTVYPFLSSMFEVDGVKYVPVSPSERTCDAIDCLYSEAAANINIGVTVLYKGVKMNVMKVHKYACYENGYIGNVELGCSGDVEDYAFFGCQNINKVSASNNGNIGVSAFQGITEEFTANINNSGYIGGNAFRQSTGLKSLIVGNNVTNINSQAFSGCTSMTSATLGEGIASIGSSAFANCSKLERIAIPNAVKAIEEYVFSGCSAMETVQMGTGVQTINTYTFSKCSSLTDMRIGSNVETINESAFSGCSSLPMIRIPSAVTDIKNYVFSGCSSLKNVIIEDREKVLNLGSNYYSPLFADCPLDSVYIGGNINYNTSSSYGYSPFYRNTSLRTVVITDKETEISANEFYGCTNLQDVKIGDGVESFGDWAFSGCSSLKNFSFGTSVKTIGKEAFSDCTAMEHIYSRSSIPPVCGTQALDDINKWNCVLTVPAGNKAAYQAADQWKEFFFVEEGEAVTKLIDVTAEKGEGSIEALNASDVSIYSPNGKKLHKLQKGLNIVIMDDGTVKKVIMK